MLTIIQGDDTAANRRRIRLHINSEDIGTGYTVGFVFRGITVSGPYVAGGHIDFNFTREQTAAFPLGVYFGRMYLQKDNLIQTINNAIPVCVTDSVERAAMASNDVNLSVIINTGVQHVDKDPLTAASTNAQIKQLANALLAAINGTPEVGPTGPTGPTGTDETA